jgi:hypothetical protein
LVEYVKSDWRAASSDDVCHTPAKRQRDFILACREYKPPTASSLLRMAATIAIRYHPVPTHGERIWKALIST